MDQYRDRASRITRSFVERTRQLFPAMPTKVLLVTGASLMLVPAGVFAWWQSVNMSSAQPAVTQDVQVDSSSSDEPLKAVIDIKQSSSSVNAQSSSGGKNEDSTIKTELQVNGQEVPLPPSKVVHKEIRNQGGKTTIDFTANSRTSGSSRSDTSMNIQLNSTSESSIDNSE